MIRLENIWKTYRSGAVTKVVAAGITATFPARTAVAVLGRNGAGKSTLMRIIAGTQDLDAGRIERRGTLSWPVGFAGGVQGDLTGAQNARFVARIHGADADALADYVQDFAELGGHFRLPVRTYSAGMRARLCFALSMGIRFDTYLVDEATAPGDAGFRARAQAVFADRLRDSGVIFITHALEQARAICSQGAVLEHGRLTWFADVDDAIRCHQDNLRRPAAA
jgi:capsular polysaccharide transport system ATP-binding protein